MASSGRAVALGAGISALCAGWLAGPAQAATTAPETAGSSPSSVRRVPTVAGIELTQPGRKGEPIVLQSGQRAPHDGLPVDGTVTGDQGEPAAFVPVTFSGSAGVRFSTGPGPLTASPDDDLSASLVGATTADGELPPVYAFFTRTGFNRITVSSGAVSRSVSVIAPSATDPYRVSVGGIAGNPGARLAVMGTVLDAFGNPVPNLTGALTLGVADPSLGRLLTRTPSTDVSGMFSTAFRANDTRRGLTRLTVALTGTPVADPAWRELAGVAVIAARAQAQASVTLSGRVRFSATGSLLGGGKARLRGTAKPGTVVDIFARQAGHKHSTRIGQVVANAEGNWGLGTTITTTTSFRARTSGVRTSVLTTTVQSNQTVRADGLGDGRVRFTVHGRPHVRGVVTIFEDGDQLAGLTTDPHGTVTTVLRVRPGQHDFRVYFEAPGTRKKGRTVSGTVR